MKFQLNKTDSITDFNLYLEKQYKKEELGFAIETKDSLIKNVDFFNSYISFNLDEETISKLKLANIVFNSNSNRFIKLKNLQLKNIYSWIETDSQLLYRLEGYCTADYIDNKDIYKRYVKRKIS